MITSKQILNNLEQYVDARKTSTGYLQIFSNPTRSELQDIVNTSKSSSSSKCLVRFLADANKRQVYVWDAFLAVHDDGRKMLSYPTDILQTPYLVNGIAWVAGGKMVAPSWTSTESALSSSSSKNKVDRGKYLNYLEKVFSLNWSWLDSYIANSNNYVKKQEIELKSLN